MLDAWTTIHSGLIWAGVSVVALIGLGWLHCRERKTNLGPEIRLDDTTTYREQPDGSRVVTKTTLAKPVRISGEGAAQFTLPPPARLSAGGNADE